MATAKENTAQKNILSLLGLVDSANIIAKGLESNVEKIVNKAREEQEKYGLDSLLHDPLFRVENQLAPAYASEADFRRLTPDEQRERLSAAPAARQAWALHNAITSFAEKPEEILQLNGKYDPKLLNAADTVIRDEKIQTFIEKDDQPLLSTYSTYGQYDKLSKDLERGKSPSPEVKDHLRKVASNGAFETAYFDWFKGYRDDARKALATLASFVAVDSTKENNFLKAGIEKSKEKAEKELENFVGEGKEWKHEVSRVTGETLAKMIKSGNHEVELKAADLFYYTQNDYHLGEREFKDVYH